MVIEIFSCMLSFYK